MKVHVEVKAIGSIIKFENSTFQKKELRAVSVEGRTPLKFEFAGNQINQINDLYIGQEVIVDFNITGIDYEKKDDKGKFIGMDTINSLRGYKVTSLK